MKKKNIILIFIIAAILIAVSYLSFKLSTKSTGKILIKDDKYLSIKYKKTYSELVSEVKKVFSEKYSSFYQEKYSDEINNKGKSYLKEFYDIKRIEISSTNNDNYPLKAEISYEYKKEAIDNAGKKTEESVSGRKRYLYKLSDEEWVPYDLSPGIIPLFFVLVILLISLIINFKSKKDIKYQDNKSGQPVSSTA